MIIDLTKKVFTPPETVHIIEQLQRAAEDGYLAHRTEANPSLLASFAGMEGKAISPKWNIKIYTYNRKKRGHSIVCVDMQVLEILLGDDYSRFIPPDLHVLRIDDAGWGFPLCGAMVGISDEKALHTATVPVSYFRNDTKDHFQTKRYLDEYARLAMELLQRFDASPATHRIEICSGYLNQPLRETLRKAGYDVRVVEIKGMLQDRLEEIYGDYIREETGADIYYDPKEIPNSEIPRRYRETLEYGKKHCPEKLKTGWESVC